MYNYLMIVMFAVEQNRNKEENKKYGQKSPELLSKELFGDVFDFNTPKGTNISIVTDNKSNKDDNVVTIEVTPEDMKRIKANRNRNSQENMRRTREQKAEETRRKRLDYYHKNKK